MSTPRYACCKARNARENNDDGCVEMWISSDPSVAIGHAGLVEVGEWLRSSHGVLI
jgi:hypothetical protein